jgi:Rrf2 family transcriptional regulator, iron-sulfur cluster assembly transcription factor
VVRLELTKRGDYAIRAMLALACGGGEQMLNAPRIAEVMDIPPRFLPQVMGDLVRAELVTSEAGRAGGYRLARPASAISLLAVIEAIEGDSRRQTCVLRGGLCSEGGVCAVHAAFFAAQDALLAELGGVSLADVAGPGPDCRLPARPLTAGA